MRENALPKHAFFYFLLLIISSALYGSYERFIFEIKTVGYVQSQSILGLFWVWVIYCFRSQLVTFSKMQATLQQISIPWLTLLLVLSSASSVKNFLGFIAEYPTSIPYPLDTYTFLSYAFFVRSVILLTIQVVIPSFIALTTVSTLKEKLSKHELARKLLSHKNS